MKDYYVYILKSEKTGAYYISCTNNLERRIEEHNDGISKYTSAGIPWVLKYKDKFSTLKEARQREIEIKSWKKRSKIESLINSNRSYRLVA